MPNSRTVALKAGGATFPDLIKQLEGKHWQVHLIDGHGACCITPSVFDVKKAQGFSRDQEREFLKDAATRPRQRHGYMFI